MAILLGDIWPIENPQDYKAHFAIWDGKDHPLDVWVRDKREWQGWQEYRPGRNDLILAREKYRKDVLLTRGGQGFNRN